MLNFLAISLLLLSSLTKKAFFENYIYTYLIIIPFMIIIILFREDKRVKLLFFISTDFKNPQDIIN